jgi:DNA invertase Pin-like site-specific DNA recombinase
LEAAANDAWVNPKPVASAQRYVAYYRVSTPQQGRSGLGLEAQRLVVLAYLASISGELLAEFTEVESGRKNERLQLKEALRTCRIYSAILVIAKLDRLARNVALTASLMESGIEFVAADFPQANRLTIHILAAVAEYEAKLISDRIKAMIVASQARGVKWGGDKHCANLHLNAARTKANMNRHKRATARALDLLPLVQQMRDSGKNLTAIAKELTRLGVKTPQDRGFWYPYAVRRIFIWASQVGPPPQKWKGNKRRFE